MAPPGNPAVPPAAQPIHGRKFDPWNSVGTGHQRAETTGPHGWRESRNKKLQGQFGAGHTGGQRVHDAVGAGALDYDDVSRTLNLKAVRTKAANSVVDMLRQPGAMSSASGDLVAGTQDIAQNAQNNEDDMERPGDKTSGIFAGLIIFVNGSTFPVVSDHKLKRLLVENGARMSLHIGRRQVTHVIVGRPSSGAGGGAGGGLAGSKLEKEIRRLRGCGIKFVGVEWVLESIKAGIRLPESRYGQVKLASKGQQSVLNVFSRAPAT